MAGSLNAMAKTPTTRMPKPPKIPAPKAEVAASSPLRTPLRTSGGRDVISTVTRMRETPMKKGR
jgi:hypothetical protein